MGNEFDELLEFLENQKNSIKENKKIEISDFTDIHSDKFSIQQSGSKGFNVKELESLMVQKLIEEDNASQNYDRPYISVTELLGCIRKVYYERKKYKIEGYQFRYPYLPLICHVGNSIHQFLQTIYTFDETEKTIISQKYNVKGRIDGLKNHCVVEIKSFDQDKYKNTYILEHFDQGNMYAYILNEDLNYKIDTVTLVYVIRNLKKIEVFDIPINNQRAISFLDRSIVLKECLDNNKVPSKIGQNDEQCKYCNYKSICKSETM